MLRQDFGSTLTRAVVAGLDHCELLRPPALIARTQLLLQLRVVVVHAGQLVSLLFVIRPQVARLQDDDQDGQAAKGFSHRLINV